MDDSTLDRREFTRLSLLAMLSGVAITISGCGGGGSSPGTPSTPNPNPGEERGDISANHGHTVVITAAQLTAGNQLLLTLTQGTPAHTHTVALTAAEVVSIRDGGRVAKATSTDELHEHTVTFN
jgi:hypothetical protein